jgi:hypothetical protein
MDDIRVEHFREIIFELRIHIRRLQREVDELRYLLSQYRV